MASCEFILLARMFDPGSVYSIAAAGVGGVPAIACSIFAVFTANMLPRLVWYDTLDTCVLYTILSIRLIACQTAAATLHTFWDHEISSLHFSSIFDTEDIKQ